MAINVIGEIKILFFVLKKFFGVPHLATCIFLIFYNEPELGAEFIDPGMALTPLPSRDRTHDLPIVSRVLYR